MTGAEPFHGLVDNGVIIMVTEGKRPQRPRHFNAPGITPGVWTVAERCWHQKTKQRPEVKTVLQNLENIANPGECAPQVGFCLL